MTVVTSLPVMPPTTTTAITDPRVAASPGPLGWLSARVRPRRLDIELASGTPAESTSALALRARRLTSLSRRRRIARAIHQLVREAHEGGSQSLLRVAPAWRQIVSAREELGRLAFLLAEPGPVQARGVAQTLLLLSDGTGPLYNPRSPSSLRASALRAKQNLR